MEKTAKRKQLDMLHGSIWNKLPLFALPVAATAILEQLFNASDIAVVGNFTGAGKTVAVAAVGANSSIIALIVNLFVGIALGANVVIANAIGRDDQEAVKKAVHTYIVVAFLGGILVAVVGEFAATPLLHSLNVPDDVFDSALLYLRIYLLGMPVILLYNFEAAIFRSVGDTRVPLIALATSGVLNVVLNLFFVAVLRMTVNGVAIATVISNAVSSVLLLWRLRISKQYIHVEWQSLRIDWKAFGQIMKIDFQQRFGGHLYWLYTAADCVLRLHVQYALRSDERLSARFWYFPRSGASDHHRCLRNPHWMDSFCVPAKQDIPDDHDRLSGQPVSRGATDFDCTALLPSVP